MLSNKNADPQASLLRRQPISEAEKNAIIEDTKTSVYRIIKEYIGASTSDPEKLKMLLEYPSRQGHYRRPILCVLSALAFGASPNESLYKLAAALQLSEDWILMLDDMQDSPALRRGKPPFHALYGPEHTVNTAAMLHSIMWDILRDALKHTDFVGAEYIWKMFNKIGHSTYNGQTDAITFTQSIRDPSAKDYRFYYGIAMDKTSEYTLSGPLQLGAYFAGRNGDIIRALERIGRPAGVAFQIINDMDDIRKGSYEDLYNSEPTLIAFYTYRESNPEEQAEFSRIFAKAKADKTSDDVAYMLSLIKKHNALVFASMMRDSFARLATARIMESSALINSVANPYMDLLISTILGQYKDEVYKGEI